MTLNKYFKPPQAYSNLATTALAAQLRKHQELLEVVRATVPAALAERVIACVLSGRKLLVYSDSAHWASQLRFFNSAILSAVNATTDTAVDVVVMRIQPPAEVIRTAAPKKRLPPAEYIDTLNSTARAVSDDSLRQALERLGATLKKIYEDADRP